MDSFEDCDEIQNALSGDKCLEVLEDRIEKDYYGSVNQVINNSRDEWVQGPAKQEETFKNLLSIRGKNGNPNEGLKKMWCVLLFVRLHLLLATLFSFFHLASSNFLRMFNCCCT